MATARRTHPIPLIYCITFLYFEPLIAFLGACQALFLPTTLLAAQTPNAAAYYRPELRPLTTQIAGGWLFLAFNDFVLLRVFSEDVKVWRYVLMGGLLCDIVFTASIIMDFGVKRFFDVRMWSVVDAGVILSTVLPMALKVTGALGVGMRKGVTGDGRSKKSL